MPATPETRLVTEARLSAVLTEYAGQDAQVLDDLVATIDNLRTDLDAQMAQRNVYVIDTPDDVDQLPPGVRPDWDVVIARSESATVPTVPAYRRALLADLPADSALPQALGTGDTALDVAPAGVNTVRLRNGARAVEVAAGTTTTRWSTGLALTVDEWSFDYEIELDTASNTSSTIYLVSGVCGLSLAPGNTLAVLNSSNAPLGTTSPALALGTLAAPKRYRVKGWKADAETLAHFRLYDPTGALVWDVTRDVGTAVPSAVIWGRTGPITSGKYFWYRNRFHNVGAELV